MRLVDVRENGGMIAEAYGAWRQGLESWLGRVPALGMIRLPGRGCTPVVQAVVRFAPLVTPTGTVYTERGV